jgi:aminoglycoside 6'-N-acetyltransferase I
MSHRDASRVSVRELVPGDADAMAHVLFAAFRESVPDAWPTPAAAADEVREAFSGTHLLLGAFEPHGTLAGWLGAIPQYAKAGRVTGWELHPLAVHPERQRLGIGALLVEHLERALTGRGASVIYLGTDDESGCTMAARLGTAPLSRLIAVLNDPDTDAGVDHPYVFYRRLGYEVCGLIPDANGPDRPDIMMCKRMRSKP